MPSVALSYSNAFSNGSRPYLAMLLVGSNASPQVATGLIDSGADISQLPIGYASLMGYAAADLEPVTATTAGSPTQVFRAKTSCHGQVIGIPDVTIELQPAFSSASPSVLWGRMDFMAAFGVTLDEKQQQFGLHW
jgi:hypothetical protein